MATDIIPVATWDTSIPTPDDGEVATGPALDAMAQPLANREQFLYQLAVVDGVKKVRRIADLTALAALTGAIDGDVAYVMGRGFYMASVPDASPADSPWLIVDAGGARWYHELAFVQASKLATLNGSGRVVQLPPMQPIASNGTHLTGTGNLFFSSAASYADATGASTSLTGVQVGDILFATMSARAILGAASAVGLGLSGYPKLALSYEHNGTTTQIAEIELRALGANDAPPAINWRHRKVISVSAGAGVPHIFKAQLLSDGTVQARLLYPFDITIEQVRP